MPMWISKLHSVIPKKTTPITSGISDGRLRLAADRFYEFRVKLKDLDGLLRRHLVNLQQTAASRASLVDSISQLGQDSPLEEVVGTPASNIRTRTNNATASPTESTSGKSGGNNGVPLDDGGESLSSSSSSYAAVQKKHSVQMSIQLERFSADIASYVTEWETTVSTRIATELKHIQNLYKTLNKYEQKVDACKSALAVNMSKVPSPSSKKKQAKQEADLEKISWNESKLRTAKKEYRRNLVAVTLFTEEVADRGWKDLIPFLIRMIDLDVDTATHAADLVQKFSRVREEITTLGKLYEMDFEAIRSGRLRVLLEEDAIDFVDAGDLQDIGSTILSSGQGEGRYSNKMGTVVVGRTKEHNPGIPTTPPSSNSNSTGQSPGEDRKNLIVQQKQTLAKYNHDDTSANPNYPSSIYCMGQEEGKQFSDDETTLTGAPDMVSI